MKKSIVTFIIGLLVGAIIATGSFYAYTELSSKDNSPASSMQGQPPEMPSGDNSSQPPEKPEGDNSSQPPEKPEGDSSNQPSEKPSDNDQSSKQDTAKATNSQA